MRRHGSGLVWAVLGFLLLGPVRQARADYEETEARLKAVGVEAPLRAEIVQAIDRGVRYLAAQQRPEGRWQDPLYADYMSGWGLTALCALAQRHAGTTLALDGAHRAMVWLRAASLWSPPPRPGRDLVPLPRPLVNVYDAGLWLMLLMADGRPAEDSRAVSTALAGSLDPDLRWWGYSALPPPRVDRPNLSTTQFAALGLWAAARSGVEVPRAVWRDHLDGLLDAQDASGSWAYWGVSHGPGSRSFPYPTATYMGLANLALSLEGGYPGALAAGTLPPRVVAARAKALSVLVPQGKGLLEEMRAGRPAGACCEVSLQQMFHFTYYALYALEKACIFNAVERLGDVPWYSTGARALLRLQSADGSWTCRGAYPDSLLSTAFALLFLLRSSEVYRPTSPRPVSAPPTSPPVTPGLGPQR